MPATAMDLYSLYLSPEQWMRYAGFWRRLAAAVIDTAMLAFTFFAVAIMVVVVVVLVPVSGELVQSDVARVGALAFALLVAWGYSAGFESSGGQGTIGKTTLGMAVCDREGQRISLRRATVRFAGKLLTCLTLGVGFVLMAFDRQKRGLDDRLAGTVVIERDPFAGTQPRSPSR